MSAPDRRLDWEGARYVRDLGGLPTGGNGVTRWGAVVRAGSLDVLTAAGWAAAERHGIRTVVDLRNDDEPAAEPTPRPASIATVRVPLDGAGDREFWDVWQPGPQFGTPLYYRPHLERLPERSAAALRAVATAPPGGVVVHCQGGRDRSGQVAMLLLAIAGVAPEAIAEDHELTPLDEASARYLAQRGTSAGRLILELLSELDVVAAMLRAGLTEAEMTALRARLVDRR